MLSTDVSNETLTLVISISFLGGELLTLDDLWENSLSQVPNNPDNSWTFITQQVRSTKTLRREELILLIDFWKFLIHLKCPFWTGSTVFRLRVLLRDSLEALYKCSITIQKWLCNVQTFQNFLCYIWLLWLAPICFLFWAGASGKIGCFDALFLFLFNSHQSLGD